MRDVSSKIKSTIKNHETPLYVYDTETIRTNYRNLRAALPKNFNILYSLKANPHPRIIAELKELGACFDVASFGELKTVLDAGVDPSRISFVGPGKTEREIRFALENNVDIIVTESIDQLMVVDRVAKQYNKIQSVTVRLNPKEYVDLKGKVRHNRSIQFGVDEEDVGFFIESVNKCSNVKFRGIHTHVQSQILDPASIAANFEMTLKLYHILVEKVNLKLDVINFGGGFGIPYQESESPLDMTLLKEKLNQFSSFSNEVAGDSIKPFAETGRYLVGQSGFFVTKVLYRKESRGKKLLVMDGGMNNNFSVVGAAQFERRNYIVTAVANEVTRAQYHSEEIKAKGSGQATQMYNYTLVGPSCYFMDTLGNDIELPEMYPGDYLVFHNSGCYGKSFSPTLFLGQQVASEIFI